MKKLLFVIFTTILTFSAKAQIKDSLFWDWSNKVQIAIKNRPHPEVFTEQDALGILKGKSAVSRTFKFKETETKNFSLFKKKRTWEEFYSITSLETGWFTTAIGFNPGTWKINYIFIIIISFNLLILIFSFFGVKYYYPVLEKKLEGNPSMTTVYTIADLIFIIAGIISMLSLYFTEISVDEVFFSIFIILWTAYLITLNKIRKYEKETKKKLN